MTEPVLVREQRGAVSILTLNRPDARNALNFELMGELGAALVEAEEDLGTRAVVLTGAGDRSFCAGMDLREFGSGAKPDERQQAGMAVVFGRFVNGQLKVPVVAAAQAAALAGGFELLLGCDVAVANEDAKFGLPEVKRALFAAGGGVLISNRIPLAIALELTLTGDPISAQRAYEVGLVNKVVPADQVLDAAIELAERIAANGPLALQATKEIVWAASTDTAAAQAKAAEWNPKVFGSADAKEGSAAFIEKRDPVWTGA
jgi:enoyl-CoA hydratase